MNRRIEASPAVVSSVVLLAVWCSISALLLARAAGSRGLVLLAVAAGLPAAAVASLLALSRLRGRSQAQPLPGGFLAPALLALLGAGGVAVAALLALLAR